MPIYEVEVNGRVFEVEAPSLRAAITAAKRQAATPTAPPEAATRGMLPQSTTETPPPSQPEGGMMERAVGALPAVGGALGGIVGGIGGTVAGMGVGGVPGALGGAALGGAAGEAGRQLASRALGLDSPDTSLQAATDIATQGATQAVSELAGHGLMRGAQMAGRGLMDFAIRPAPTMVEEFGDIAETAVRERLPVGRVLPGARTGSQRAKAALRESAGTTRRLLEAADATGRTFDPAAIARGPVTQLVGDIAKQPLSTDELSHVSRLFAEYLDTHPGRMQSRALKDMKQAAQRIAKPIFRALNRGDAVPAGESIKAQFNRAIAEGSKGALETIPDVAASEARTQGLIGATKAIRRAEARRLPLVAEIAAPVAGATVGAYGGGLEGAAHGVGTAVLTRALLSPRTTSRMALGLTDAKIQQALRQMPRGAVYALMEALQEERQNQGDE